MPITPNKERAAAAGSAADILCEHLRIIPDSDRPIGFVLGTGWDVLKLDNRREIPFRELPGFETLGTLDGHARTVVAGRIGNQLVLALSGRVHLNEGHGEDVVRMVRLQTEMLCLMGIQTLIVTSAVGALTKHSGAGLFRDVREGRHLTLQVGDVAIVDGFITEFAPPMPLWGGEFISPEDMLDSGLRGLARGVAEKVNLRAHEAAHVMVRGPQFEGRRYDKRILAELGASVVGMSMLPEACVAALYGVKVLGLGFVTNDDVAEHSHDDNQARAKEASAKLGALLAGIVRGITKPAT